MRTTLVPTVSLLSLAAAQMVTVPTTCSPPFPAGTDEVLHTLPYPYAAVMSIIGSYQNLTWSGNPKDTVTLNGSDNTVGTARTYSLAGALVIETLLTYDSPASGPYYENHNVAELTIPRPASAGGNVSAYFPLDSTYVASTCGGMATSFNMTAVICSNTISAAVPLVHMLHLGDVMTVGKYLGGENFTTCEALEGMSGSASGTSPPTATYTGGAAALGAGIASVAVAAGALLLL